MKRRESLLERLEREACEASEAEHRHYLAFYRGELWQASTPVSAEVKVREVVAQDTRRVKGRAWRITGTLHGVYPWDGREHVVEVEIALVVFPRNGRKEIDDPQDAFLSTHYVMESDESLAPKRVLHVVPIEAISPLLEVILLAPRCPAREEIEMLERRFYRGY